MMEWRETWTPTQAEFDRFAQVSGDDNPIHVDPDFSARTTFGRTVSHGMLLYTRLWGMVRTARPGAVAMRQSMIFPNPAFAGEELQLVVEGAVPGVVTMRAWRVADDAEVFLGDAEVK